MKFDKSLLKPLSGLVLHGGINCLITAVTGGASAPVSVFAALAGAITGNLASNHVAVLSNLSYDKVLKRLSKADPEKVNHDLERLFRQSAVVALDYIKTSFLTHINKDHRLEDLSDEERKEFIQGLTYFFNENIEDLRLAIIDDIVAVDKNSIKAPSSFLDRIVADIFILTSVKFDPETKQKLQEFYAAQLPYCFELAFKEALKNDEPGFKAFQIWILEDLRDQNAQLLHGQQHLLETINNLRERSINYLPKEEADKKAEEQAQKIYNLLEQDLTGIKQTLIVLSADINQNFDKVYRINQLTYEKVLGMDITLNRMEHKLDVIAENRSTNINLYPHELNLIPRHTDEFIGRENDLEKLEAELNNSAKVVLVNGLGGIGKTTLAKKYLQIHAKEYNHVAWIEIKQDDLIATDKSGEQAFIGAFAYDKTLWANGLNLKIEDTASLQERFNSIIHAIKNMAGKNLLVIDNVGEEIKKFNKILPTPPSWHVLVTSRNILSGFTPFHLDKLEKNKAIELFRTWYEADEKEIEVLLEETDYHTLMIEMLAKTLQASRQRLTIEYLTERLKTGHLDDVKLQRRIELSHTQEETQLLKHLLLTFQFTALNETEIFLLKNFYFLLPQYYKLDSILYLLQVAEEDENNIIDSLDNLAEKGWLSREDNFYSMHRLIQQVIFYQLNLSVADAETLFNSFTRLTYTDAHSDRTIAFNYIPYVEHLLDKASNEEFDNEFQTSLLINLSNLYSAIKEYQKAENASLEALNIYRSLAQNNPVAFEPNVAMALTNLGASYRDIQEYQKAENASLEALNIYRSLAQNNPVAFEPNVATALNNLGILYRDIQEYEKAEKASLEALNIYRSLAQNNPVAFEPNVATALNNLGILYRDIQEYEKAEKAFSEALEIRKKLAQNNPVAFEPNVAITLNNLGILYRDIKEYEKAENASLEALNIYRSLAQNNPVAFEPDVALALTNLGVYTVIFKNTKKPKRPFQKLWKSEESWRKAIRSPLSRM
ncbi:hypothetical protein AHMF7605_24175 [Adhaeribacter arboris]|uniref:NB-ARC domain-containing protein n=1 Tax=Adhaeribacter arboris TaxID=2072846 RepID=A0A2T2YLH8_9BACT|nr:tetratricopeptide repeat protein [Adhaeribacter arboris]PSR56372.1 hypothetical protein AHMF7605_24175 [Adhaeribacter arboris]